MKKLFLVLGPESSGNHIVTQILVRMGCFGTYVNGTPQFMDDFLSGKATNEVVEDVLDYNLLVLRRSIPYGIEWPDPVKIRSRFAEYGYGMVTIIVCRSWLANIVSNYYHRANTIEEALENLTNEWIYIGERLKDIKPFYFFDTSRLFKDPESAILELETFTGLKWPSNISFSEINDPDKRKFELVKTYGFKSIDREIFYP